MNIKLQYSGLMITLILLGYMNVHGCTTPSLYTCQDGTRIPTTYQCDGDRDCSNGEDELNCNVNCGKHERKCENSNCIPANWWCDGESDCPDSSDERRCPARVNEHGFHNQTGNFTCHDQSRISKLFHCDGSADCPDGSDEVNCTHTCGPHQWKCDYFDCIPATWWCDGQNDCPDDSDEKHCLTQITEASPHNSSLLSRIEAAALVSDNTEKQVPLHHKSSPIILKSSSASLLHTVPFTVVFLVVSISFCVKH